jgi:5-hydroxyisourate hydrolase
MAGTLTTHALDTELGRPGAGMQVELRRLEPAAEKPLASLRLDENGRAILIEDAALIAGTYELVFFLGDYLRARGVVATEPPFLDRVPVRFGVADGGAHYHVPLVFGRHGYTTYRGG